MPNLEEHCKHSLKRYDIEGRDIHIWLDEPSQHYAGLHREFRHDEKAMILVGKTFGKMYGEEKAQAIALDHIMADHEESIKKRSEKNGVALSETKTYYEEKPKYEKKKEELRRELRLSEIKTRRIRNYIQSTYAHRKESLFDLAVTSLLDWENYCLSRENPNSNIERKDITGYVNNLFNRAKPVNPRTAAHYLGFLVAYLKHDNREDLANYANDEKKNMLRSLGRLTKMPSPCPSRTLLSCTRVLH